MARGREAAERADRHAQQKAYRDLKRKSSAGGWTVMVGSSVKLSPEDEARVENTYFAEDVAFEELCAMETELIRDYPGSRFGFSLQTGVSDTHSFRRSCTPLPL